MGIGPSKEPSDVWWFIRWTTGFITVPQQNDQNGEHLDQFLRTKCDEKNPLLEGRLRYWWSRCGIVSKGWLSDWYDRTNRLTKRLPEKRYVFWNQKAPTGQFGAKQEWNKLTGFCNWTMTYRWNLDIIHPYGWITPAIHNPYPVPMHPNKRQLERLKVKTSVSHAVSTG